jgi:hypothetical protein
VFRVGFDAHRDRSLTIKRAALMPTRAAHEACDLARRRCVSEFPLDLPKIDRLSAIALGAKGEQRLVLRQLAEGFLVIALGVAAQCPASSLLSCRT